MKDRKKALIWLIILGICLAFVIWHTVRWHKTGVHARISQDVKAGKIHLAIIYNLGLMATLGILIGFLMEKLTDLIGYEVTEMNHFEDEDSGQVPTGAAGEGEAS
ncbi:MAG: hypothetical protein AMS15_06430 [Planctomycetes bacterium DG_23]|nr:MAG: hypothetical protein AMS15_06430 [Planctomycetes bacterium DG_23]